MPFVVIFRLVREKLLVTVALDHPVAWIYFYILVFIFSKYLHIYVFEYLHEPSHIYKI